MVKVRMNTADVAAEVKCLRRLIGMRCSNVYDLSPKTYVFKLMNSSGITESGESEKVLLLMESGVRLHTTVYLRDKSNTPSGFTLKLRKHIRTRRLEDVRQLGYDRIIVFQFGRDSNANYVILELYAQGNIILTDSELMVMTLLRSHRDDDKGYAIMSRHLYPVDQCRVFERTTTEKIIAAINSPLEPDKSESIDGSKPESIAPDASLGKENGSSKSTKNKELTKNASESARAKQPTLKTVLGQALGYGPALSEHIILDAGLVPNTKMRNDFKLEGNGLQLLVEAVARFEDWLEDIISGDKIPEGFILMQQTNSGKNEGIVSNKIYDEFCPLLLNQFNSRESTRFETFDAALDEFYSKIESQRSEQQYKAKESSAVQKLNKIRTDQENRVLSLKKEVEQYTHMAELIEYNLDDVDAAILAVRVALANGMSWEDLARMVKDEKKSGNPIAGLIDKLHLERNCITLLLSNNLDEMDDDEKTQPADKVEVDLALSAHANARRWYEMKKKQESKQEKTVTAHEKAFKAAEKKTRLQISQEKTVSAISHMRKVHWFEKFNWFISSENYLVISGRDAQQNELIVKRYMSKGDLYVHADLHGASSTVIKNHKPDSSIPPLTLNQTGIFTVCHSQAWDSKIVTSAWWVYPNQVSKTAPTGEYLTVGSFMIRGKKNFLPPHPLIMGFGILFRLDESCLGFHLNERRVKGEEEGINDFAEGESFREISESESDKEVSDEKLALGSQSHVDSLGNKAEPVSLASEAVSHDESDTINDDVSASVKYSAETSKDEISGNAKYSSETSKDEISGDASASSTQLEDLMDKALELGSSKVSANKYAFQESVVSVEEQNQEAEKEIKRDKPYVSKAQRRKLKKGETDNAADERFENGKEEAKENHEAVVFQPEEKVSNIKQDAGKLSRGQRSKLKKMKEKYADQDEEERSIRISLLAAAGKPQKNDKVADTTAKASTSNEEKPVTGGIENAPKICYKCKKVGHLARDCPELPGENLKSAADNKAVSRSGASLIDAGGKDEMDRVEMEEDDVNEIGEEEKEKLKDVDYLTGIPRADDILLYAIPVCAPYTALQSYKYRVKLVPGTVKKGKAAKTAMNLFGHMSEATSREKELMKACTDPELVAAIIGNVKVTAAGLAQMKQKQKKSKKSSKKVQN